MKNFLVLLILFFFISCNNDSIPRNIIKPDQMQKIFWDVIKGDKWADEIVKRDSTKNIKNESFAISEKVFLIHHITRDKFEKSITFYANHPELLQTVFDSLYAIQSRKDSVQKRRSGRSPNFIPHIIRPQ